MTLVPSSTYRLQITPSFPLSEAAGIVDYLDALGVSHVYTSPLLTAAAGSEHGYDVVSHTEVGTAIGGEAGRRALVDALRARGLGLVVDIVPNHMGVANAEENAQWWDVLKLGSQSVYARWFDIDWIDGRVLLPVLGDDTDLERDLRIEDGELRYFEHRFPLAPGTAPGDEHGRPGAPSTSLTAAEAHEHQHYKLVNWREADTTQNYRRFFAVTTLAGIKVEDPIVFEATHRLFTQWVADGEADGLRIDHPDGLADPLGYLQSLRAAAPGAWITVEKITEPGETLPASWPVSGMTGYDALTEVTDLVVDPAGEAKFDEVDARLAGARSWAQYVQDGKRMIAGTILRAEFARLGRVAPEVPGAPEALAELAIAFPVYRSYLPEGRAYFDEAVALAVERRPAVAATLELLLPRLTDPGDELCVRFQQTTGALMAKGVEDTAYYRGTRLISLNEVGGDPGTFGGTLANFHERAARRQAGSPEGMTTLSTHDTKRGEDVRARISVLAEIGDDWAEVVSTLLAAAPAPDASFAHLVWQTVVGLGGPRPETRERMHAYLEKAMREAAQGTSWFDPAAEFEARTHDALDALYDNPEARAALQHVAAQVEPFARINSLTQKLVQLTMPGVPDVYQGTEVWDDSLVDPDNRRPVDYAARRAMLAGLSVDALPPIDETGAAKMWVVTQVLHARRDHPEYFVGYTPLPADGSAAEHAVAFDRGGAIAVATRLPVGLAAAGGWGDTSLSLPDGPWRDALTGSLHDGGSIGLATLLGTYPVALLLSEGTR
ncbi:MAG: malto-oligosyltrehalose synthase [Jatrophihabitantaceae bacterium]|nr:malto-oligosyltrehalose synthase [Jatrophihabitantaceae bacterium]